MVVDKPAGVTSQGLVGQLRKRFNERQIGHAGTLDPDATGLMLIGVGRVTRLLTFLVGMDKTYTGEITFGARTSTLDAAGKVLERYDMEPPSIGEVRLAIAKHLTGEIMQVPPMVSAIQVDGKRLHQLAREGVEIERKPRPVRVDRFDVEPTDDPMTVSFTVDCASGTYIRSLADDLGRLIGGGAFLKTLRRTRVDGFTLADAAGVDAAALLPAIAAVPHMPRVDVVGDEVARILHGAVLDGDERFSGTGPWAVCVNGELLAVYERHRNDTVKPNVVIAQPQE